MKVSELSEREGRKEDASTHLTNEPSTVKAITSEKNPDEIGVVVGK